MARNRDSTTAIEPDDLALRRARGTRWLPDRPITSIGEAARYLDDVGFALLFPAGPIAAPSLWEAVAGPDAVPFAAGMGPAESLVWTWKDELPRDGLAWYGRFLYRRASLLAPRLLAALYAGAGDPTDHQAFGLPEDGHRIAEALVTGPLTSAALRELTGNRSRYDRAMVALQQNLLVTSAGVRQQRTGWPAAVIELTCRRFDVGRGCDPAYAVARFVETMIEATPRDLARAYGWPVTQAASELAGLDPQ